MDLFREFRQEWNHILINNVESEVRHYFTDIDLAQNHLPQVRIYEAYSGSWIVEASLVMIGGIGTVYSTLKAISELPKMADDLTALKDKLKRSLSKDVNRVANDYLETVTAQQTDIYSLYETALNQSIDRMGSDHPRYSEALVYQQRLIENITYSRRYGEHDARKVGR